MSENELYFEDVELGDDLGPVKRVITLEQVQGFVKLWGDEEKPSRFTSQQVAIDEGLPGAIVPGAMNIGILAQVITGWCANVVLRTLDLVFRQMVRHDVTYYLKGIVTDKEILEGIPTVECDVWMEELDGTRLVIGKAAVIFPMRGSTNVP